MPKHEDLKVFCYCWLKERLSVFINGFEENSSGSKCTCWGHGEFNSVFVSLTGCTGVSCSWASQAFQSGWSHKSNSWQIWRRHRSHHQSWRERRRSLLRSNDARGKFSVIFVRTFAEPNGLTKCIQSLLWSLHAWFAIYVYHFAWNGGYSMKVFARDVFALVRVKLFNFFVAES